MKTGGRLIKARPLSLVATGREPPYAATLRGHGTADRFAVHGGRVPSWRETPRLPFHASMMLVTKSPTARATN